MQFCSRFNKKSLQTDIPCIAGIYRAQRIRQDAFPIGRTQIVTISGPVGFPDQPYMDIVKGYTADIAAFIPIN